MVIKNISQYCTKSTNCVYCVPGMRGYTYTGEASRPVNLCKKELQHNIRPVNRLRMTNHALCLQNQSQCDYKNDAAFYEAKYNNDN